MVNSIEEARRAADACWYPPRGKRSFGPVLAALKSGRGPYLEAAKAIEVWAMVETREALEAVEGIAAVDGITGLYVGPNDLGLALGLPPKSDRDEPQIIDAYRNIIAAAGRSGKSAGLFCASAAYARRMVELGFSMVTVIGDVAVLAAGAASACAAMKE